MERKTRNSETQIQFIIQPKPSKAQATYCNSTLIKILFLWWFCEWDLSVWLSLGSIEIKRGRRRKAWPYFLHIHIRFSHLKQKSLSSSIYNLFCRVAFDVRQNRSDGGGMRVGRELLELCCQWDVLTSMMFQMVGNGDDGILIEREKGLPRCVGNEGDRDNVLSYIYTR